MDNITRMLNIKQFMPTTKTSLCVNDSHHAPVLDKDKERNIPSYIRLNSIGEVEDETLYRSCLEPQNAEMSHKQHSLLGDPATFSGPGIRGSPSNNFCWNGIQQSYQDINPNGKRWYDHTMAGNIFRQSVQTFQFQQRLDRNKNFHFGFCNMNQVPYPSYQDPRFNSFQLQPMIFNAPIRNFNPNWYMNNYPTPGPSMTGAAPHIHRQGSPRRKHRGKKCQKHPINRTEMNRCAHNNSKSSPTTATPRCTGSPCQKNKKSKCDSEKPAFQEEMETKVEDKQAVPLVKSLKEQDPDVQKLQKGISDLGINSVNCRLGAPSDLTERDVEKTADSTTEISMSEAGNENMIVTLSKQSTPSLKVTDVLGNSSLCRSDKVLSGQCCHKVPEVSPEAECTNFTVTVKKDKSIQESSQSDAIHIVGKFCDKNDKAAKDSYKNGNLTCDKVQSFVGECYTDVDKEQSCLQPADKDIPDMEIEFKDSTEIQDGPERNVFANVLFTPGKKGKKGRPSSKKRRRMKLQRDPDNVSSVTTKESSNSAANKKIKTSHEKDEIGANSSSSSIHVEIKCNDISVEQENDSNFQSKTPSKQCSAVAFILGVPSSSDDEDEGQTSDIKSDKTQTNKAPSPMMTKFSFVISHSDSDFSSDTDSDFGSEDEEVDSSFSSELWDSFANPQDSSNPFKLQISYRLTPPAKGKPLPKSASDSDIASSKKLAQVNNKWNIRYSVQLENDRIRGSPEKATSSRSCEKKKVHFPVESDLEEMVPLPDWDVEQGMEERKGPWEQCARDRCRFASRIKEVEEKISFIFEPELRKRVYDKLHKD